MPGFAAPTRTDQPRLPGLVGLAPQNDHGDLGWLEPEEFFAWRLRVRAERLAHNLTACRRDALLALLEFHDYQGLFPSDAAVAKRAGVSERTVRRARADARELGLLTWQHTRKQGSDGRWRQGPNRYTVTVPSRPVSAGQIGRGKKVSKLSSLGGKRQPGPGQAGPAAVLPEDRAAAQAALVAMAAAREAHLAARWAARAAAAG